MSVVWFIVGALAAVAKGAMVVMGVAERNTKELYRHRYEFDDDDC
ncbi:hypothetical protein [Deinococcus metallilatus]|uniref:Uncharacterized protein n=1 Tax=Deinococcus metallilatus TaxID=1211322 RepID=A0ABR6N1Z2_9DEIO|nr:hypothetical protein [Deinococcus metallilatus]MBB5297222.1 hypothetical protein [Deinococcus metallilatus]